MPALFRIVAVLAYVFLANAQSAPPRGGGKRPTLSPSQAPTGTPRPSNSPRPTVSPTLTQRPTPKPTMYPTIKGAVQGNVPWSTVATATIGPAVAAVLGIIIAAWIYVRDRSRKKKHDAYLEELEEERSAYRAQLVAERSTTKGLLWGTSKHELDARELHEVEAEVSAHFPDEMLEPPDYAHMYKGFTMTVSRWGGSVYAFAWKGCLQGDIEVDHEHRRSHTEHFSGGDSEVSMSPAVDRGGGGGGGGGVDANSDGGGNPRTPEAGGSFQASPLLNGSFKQSPPPIHHSASSDDFKKSFSAGKTSFKDGHPAVASPSLPGASPSPLRTPNKSQTPSSAGSFTSPNGRVRTPITTLKSEQRLSHASSFSSLFDDDGDEGGGDGGGGEGGGPGNGGDRNDHHDEFGEILGFPKDCGPREGVHILSFKRAMHVKAMNHPHIAFERKGHGLSAWTCTSEGFYSVRITDCVDEALLPTPDTEATAYTRALKKRQRALKRLKLEKAEIVSRLKAEFPKVDSDAAVRYIVSFPLDYDFGMHGCGDLGQDSCGLGQVQRLVGCLDEKPLEEPLAQYGTGIMLYFKFFKVMIHVFVAYALLAACNVYVNYSGSGYSLEQKSSMMDQGGVAAGVFFTTLGSWGEKTVQCRQEVEGTSFSMKCGGRGAVFTSIEAFYGQPKGSCTCPSDQQLVGEPGEVPECPSDADYSKEVYGECKALDTLAGGGGGSELSALSPLNKTKHEFCLQGFTPFGGQCCSGTAGPGPDHLADFSDLLPGAKKGCDSDTAQFIANAECLGKSNCTLLVRSNKTYEWPIAQVKVLGESHLLGCGDLEKEALFKKGRPQNCSATLKSHTSDFDRCQAPSSASSSSSSSSSGSSSFYGEGLELFIVGTCWTDTMTVGGGPDGGGSVYEKKHVAQAFAYLDALMVACMMYVFKWLKAKEEEEVKEQDAARCTASDFTCRLVFVPKEYLDTDVLRQELKRHFEGSLTTHRPAVDLTASSLTASSKTGTRPGRVPGVELLAEERASVADVNFGFDDQAVLRAKQLRGKIARKLDLSMTKVRLLETYGAQDFAASKLKAAEARVRRLVVKFKEQCKILENAPPRRVRTAFVTFATRRQRDACLEAYRDRGALLTPTLRWLQQCLPACFATTKNSANKPVRFQAADPELKASRKGFTVRMVEASEPENLIWENLGLSWLEKAVRVFVSTVFTVALLVCGTALVVVAINEQAAVNAEYPATDCTPYRVEPFNALNYTLLDLLERPNARGGNGGNGTGASERWGSPYTYSPGEWGDLLTPDAIIEDQRPADFNLTEGSSGVLTCFCTALLYKTAAGCGKGEEFEGECGLFNMRRFPFTNRRERTWYFCDDWYTQTQQVYFLTYGSAVGIALVNVGLKTVLRKLVNLEAPESETVRIVSLTQKLFVALLVNTAILSLIIKGNLQTLTGGSTQVDNALREVRVFQGLYGDFGSDWYLGVGAAIAITMMVNVVSPQATKIVVLGIGKAQQFYDRGFRFSHHFSLTRKATQHDLEELYLGPSIELEELYAGFLNNFFVCMMFNSGMPLLTIIFLGYLMLSYSFDKLTFLRLYRLPPALDATAAIATTNMLQYALMVHILLAIWMYSNPDIFELEAFLNFDPDETLSPGAVATVNSSRWIEYNCTGGGSGGSGGGSGGGDSEAYGGGFVVYGNQLTWDAHNCTNLTTALQRKAFNAAVASAPAHLNATNATGFWETFSVTTESFAVSSVGILSDASDALAAIESVGAFARLVQTVQTAAYIPLLAFYLLSTLLSVLFQFFPELQDRAESFKAKQLELMEAKARELGELGHDLAADAMGTFGDSVNAADDLVHQQIVGGDATKTAGGGGGGGGGSSGAKKGAGNGGDNDDDEKGKEGGEQQKEQGGQKSREADENAAMAAEKSDEMGKRRRALTAALKASEGLDDLDFFASLPMELLAGRLAANHLEEDVLECYEKELARRVKAEKEKQKKAKRKQKEEEMKGKKKSSASAASAAMAAVSSAPRDEEDEEEEKGGEKEEDSAGSDEEEEEEEEVVEVKTTMDGLESYNIASNYRYIDRFGLDSNAMMLHRKGKLKVDHKLYLQDLKDIGSSGLGNFCFRLFTGSGLLDDEQFPEPDVEIEATLRKLIQQEEDEEEQQKKEEQIRAEKEKKQADIQKKRAEMLVRASLLAAAQEGGGGGGRRTNLGLYVNSSSIDEGMEFVPPPAPAEDEPLSPPRAVTSVDSPTPQSALSMMLTPPSRSSLGNQGVGGDRGSGGGKGGGFGSGFKPRRSSVNSIGSRAERAHAKGAIAKSLSVLGVPMHHAIFGPVLVINLPTPPDLLELVASTKINTAADEFHEPLRVVTFDLPGLGLVKIALPKGIGSAGVAEVQVAIPAVEMSEHKSLWQRSLDMTGVGSLCKALCCLCKSSSSSCCCAKSLCKVGGKVGREVGEGGGEDFAYDASSPRINLTDAEADAVSTGASNGAKGSFSSSHRGSIGMVELGGGEGGEGDGDGLPPGCTLDQVESALKIQSIFRGRSARNVLGDEKEATGAAAATAARNNNTGLHAATTATTKSKAVSKKKSRRAMHEKAYKRQHIIKPQEFVCRAPEEVVLEARIPIRIDGVGKLMAKWPHKAKAGTALTFHLPCIQHRYEGHFPAYSIVRPTVGPDGLTMDIDALNAINPCGYATIAPMCDRQKVAGATGAAAGAGAAVDTLKVSTEDKVRGCFGLKKKKADKNAFRAAGGSGKKKRKSQTKASLDFIKEDDDDDEEEEDEDNDEETAKQPSSPKSAAAAAATAEKLLPPPLIKAVHLQAEAYCPKSVIKNFSDAPLWQTLGSCGGRALGFESLVPHDSVVVVARTKDDQFLGCSVRHSLKVDPGRLLHGQRVVSSTAGGAAFQLFADDVVLTPGIHGRLVATRGFLPWPADWNNPLKSGLASEALVPFLDAVFVDMPAVHADDTYDTAHHKATRRPSAGEKAAIARGGGHLSRGLCRKPLEPEMATRRRRSTTLQVSAAQARKSHLEGVDIGQAIRGWETVDTATGQGDGDGNNAKRQEAQQQQGTPSLRADAGHLYKTSEKKNGVDGGKNDEDEESGVLYQGVAVHRQEFNVMATKAAEHRHGTGKHWLAQECTVGVPMLGHLDCVFPPQTCEGLTSLTFELPALEGPLARHFNTPETRQAAQKEVEEETRQQHRGSRSAESSCSKLLRSCGQRRPKAEAEEAAFQVGWAVTALTAHGGGDDGGDDDVDHVTNPTAVLVLPLMVSHSAFVRSVERRNESVAKLKKACSMPHFHPHATYEHHHHHHGTQGQDHHSRRRNLSGDAHPNNAAQSLSPIPMANGVTSPAQSTAPVEPPVNSPAFSLSPGNGPLLAAGDGGESGSSDDDEEEPGGVVTEAKADNGEEVLLALEEAVEECEKFRGRDKDVCVGDPKIGGMTASSARVSGGGSAGFLSGHEHSGGASAARRAGLLGWAEFRIAKLRRHYPLLAVKADAAKASRAAALNASRAQEEAVALAEMVKARLAMEAAAEKVLRRTNLRREPAVIEEGNNTETAAADHGDSGAGGGEGDSGGGDDSGDDSANPLMHAFGSGLETDSEDGGDSKPPGDSEEKSDNQETNDDDNAESSPSAPPPQHDRAVLHHEPSASSLVVGNYSASSSSSPAEGSAAAQRLNELDASSDFAQFLFAKVSVGRRGGGGRRATEVAAQEFQASTVPGTNSRGWTMVKAAHKQNVVEHRHQSPEALDESRVKLKQFLESAVGLPGDKYLKFLELGVDSVAEALDQELVSDEALKEDVGLTNDELKAFRKKASEMKAGSYLMSKETAVL